MKNIFGENLYWVGWGMFIGIPFGASLIAGNSFIEVLQYVVLATAVYTILFAIFIVGPKS